MRTFVISVLLMVGLASSGFAQSLRVGVKLGGSLTNGVGKDAKESKFLFAYHGGDVLNLGLGILGDSIVSIQPEVLYSVKGDQATSYGPSILAKLTYVDVPLLLKVNAGGLFFEAGPQFSYLLSSTPNLTKANASAVNLDLDTFEYNKTDYGFALGFGYQDPKGMNVGWRYSQGLNNVLKVGATTPTIHNSTIQLYVGFLLNPLFGKK